jgi:hypothetical protein
MKRRIGGREWHKWWSSCHQPIGQFWHFCLFYLIALNVTDQMSSPLRPNPGLPWPGTWRRRFYSGKWKLM